MTRVACCLTLLPYAPLPQLLLARRDWLRVGLHRFVGSFEEDVSVINPPRDERQARINPVGLYVTNASWAKILQEK